MSNQVSVIHHQIADVQNTNPLSIKNHFDTCWRKIFHLNEKQRRALLYKELFLLCFQYMLRLSAPPSPPGRELESTLFLRQVKVESWPNIAGGRKPGVCPYRHGYTALIKTLRPALHHATGSMGNNRVNHGGRPKGLAGTQALSLIKQDHFRWKDGHN